MEHRHINQTEWTSEAIDSALERGNLENWRELFAAARKERTVAQKLLSLAANHSEDGTYALVRGVLERINIKPETN